MAIFDGIRTRTKRSKQKETAIAPVQSEVKLDYPQAGEAVTSPSYTIRIDIPEADRAEVSIDDGAWQPCRFSVGYWWYDWSGYGPGKHQISAQAHAKDGRLLISRSRQVTVSLDRVPAK